MHDARMHRRRIPFPVRRSARRSKGEPMDRRLGSGLAALVGACVALSALPASAATGPATVRITNVQTSLRAIDQGPRGHGAGDLEIIRQSLYNRRVSSK